MPYLVLLRHGESTWNASGKIAGTADIALTATGRKQAVATAQKLQDIPISAVFGSPLWRTIQSYEAICPVLGLENIAYIEAVALAEHDFGTYTGRLKADLKKELGADGYRTLMNSWGEPTGGGESLSDVYNRAKEYFKKVIQPLLMQGDNVLVISHHHTLRALMSYLGKDPHGVITSEKIANGGAVVYELDKNGEIITRRLLS